MMTDMQGYTSKSSNSSRVEIVEMIRNHNKLMVPIIEFYGGNIVKTIGDAFLVTFESATDAVVCSIVIQLMINEYNNGKNEEESKLFLRVVINTGDVSIENNDVYGNAVNITSRMENLECFPGGSIGISESTYLLLNRSEIFAEKIGEFELKGIPYAVTVYSIPLQKQNITTIPTKLLKLVNKMSSPGINVNDIVKDMKVNIEDIMGKYKVKENLNNFKDEIKKKGKEIKDIVSEKIDNDDFKGEMNKKKDKLKTAVNKGLDFLKNKIKM